MKKYYAITILILVSITISFAGAPPKQWDKRFGSSGSDQAKAVQYTSDGGYIIVASSQGNIGGDKTEDSKGGYDYWIVKTDGLGNKQWDKTFGGDGGDWAYDIKQTSDGGYIIAGHSSSTNSGDKTEVSRGGDDYWIVKTDSLGNKQWDKRFGGSSSDQVKAIQQTSDGGYVIFGRSNSTNDGDKVEASWGGSYDYWIVKTDSSGNKEWDKTFGGSGSDWARAIQQTSDGGYIVGGMSSSTNDGDRTEDTRGSYDYWIVKTDGSGNKQWDKRFGGSGFDNFGDVKQTSDGGYIITGWTGSTNDGDRTEVSKGGVGDYDIWIVKIDSVGNKQWDRSYGSGDDDYGYSIELTRDGGYVIGGFTRAVTNDFDMTEVSRGGDDYWIVKLDSAGNKQWDKRLGGSTSDQGYSIDVTSDGGYVIAGYAGSATDGDITETSRGSSDYWIVKLMGPVVNDFDGDYKSDQAVFDNVGGYWYIKTVDNVLISWSNQWGFAGAIPVPGDYDGDGVDDLAVFDTVGGYWYVKDVSGSVLVWRYWWGLSGGIPLSGDYDGDGVDDLAIYDNVNGSWLIKTALGFEYDQWGFAGAVPVRGDYDGDGTDDLAVYDPNSGNWYIKIVSGAVIAWKHQWGFAGVVPVRGDYDGDGIDDLAVYDPNSGNWYIKTVSGSVITWANNCGFAGTVPVSGDYDGDGVDDLAVFDTVGGYWYVKTVSGSLITWANQWGWSGAEAVGQATN